jgi:hypothetical protein
VIKNYRHRCKAAHLTHPVIAPLLCKEGFKYQSSILAEWQLPCIALSPAVIDQKIDYIHENPVRAGFVGSAYEFWYSSANPESRLKVIY